jgi:hypothetical protein
VIRERIQQQTYVLTFNTVLQKELYNGIPNVTLWRMLRKRLLLKAYKLFIVQGVERWIVCTVKVFVTLATQQHLEYHYKALFETPSITDESHIES